MAATQPTLRIVVIDRNTNQPIRGVTAWWPESSGVTDSLGTIQVSHFVVDSAPLVMVRRGYLPRDTMIYLRDLPTQRVTALERATPPCCDLTGRWEVVVYPPAESAGHSPVASGHIVFSHDVTPDSLLHWMAVGDPIRYAWGTLVLSLGPDSLQLGIANPEFAGLALTPSTSSPRAEAVHYSADSVILTLVLPDRPWGVTMIGRIAEPRITGTWYLLPNIGGDSGRFLFHRRQ
jgi:hypothetical protein